MAIVLAKAFLLTDAHARMQAFVHGQLRQGDEVIAVMKPVMKRKRSLMSVTMAALVLVSLCAVAEVAAPAAAQADKFYIPTLTGPQQGTVGHTLTYYATVSQCDQVNGIYTNCVPAVGRNIAFRVTPSAGGQERDYSSTTDGQGQATAVIQFPSAGQYTVRLLGIFSLNIPSTTVTITGDNTQTSTPPTATPSGGSSGNGLSGGGILPAVQLPAVQLPALPGSAAGSSATDSTWAWLLAIVVIILLAIIVVVLLMRRRGPDEYDREGSYRRERRYRR